MPTNFVVPSGQMGRSPGGEVPEHKHPISDVNGLGTELDTLRTAAAAAGEKAGAAEAAADEAKTTAGTALEKAQQALDKPASGPAIEPGENVTFSTNSTTGATVINAGGGSSGGQSYTVNGQGPDETGNFTLTKEGLGAAESVHTHPVDNVVGLQEALDGKAPTNHTHPLVSGISVDGAAAISGVVTLDSGSNVTITHAGQVVTVSATPATVDAAGELTDANTGNAAPVQFFTGTAAEWAAFTKAAGVRYVVFLYE